MAVAAEMAPAAQPEVIYVNAEDGEPYALESLCMNCHGTVSTADGGMLQSFFVIHKLTEA